jgi:hypothetical protein
MRATFGPLLALVDEVRRLRVPDLDSAPPARRQAYEADGEKDPPYDNAPTEGGACRI